MNLSALLNSQLHLIVEPCYCPVKTSEVFILPPSGNLLYYSAATAIVNATSRHQPPSRQSNWLSDPDMIIGSLSDHLTLHMSASVWMLWRLGHTESRRKAATADNQGAATLERCSSLGCWSFVTLLTSGEGVGGFYHHLHTIIES